MKRLFDVLVSSIALVILLVPFLLVILVLKVTGVHRAWFLQERVGQHAETFRVFKFVTMRPDAEWTGTKDITLRDDPRVLPVGRFLRKAKINELPQMINVLLGNMSIVGWRPLMPAGFSEYDEQTQRRIVQVKPGLTGIGSVVFRDEEEIVAEAVRRGWEVRACYHEEIMPYKGRLELWYVENQSMALDLKIVAATLLVLFFPRVTFHGKWFRDLPEPASDIVRRHVVRAERRADP